MKKLFAVVLLMLLAGVVFAVDFSLSAGGGGLLGYTFTRYKLEGGSVESFQNMDRFNYAGFLFFDATYAEFSVLLQGGRNSWTENMAEGSFVLSDDKGTGSETSLGFSLLGKYPFSLNKQFSLFPLFGVEYQIALVQKRKPEGGREYDRSRGKGVAPVDQDKNGNSYPVSVFNSWWIDVGAGLDYNISGPLFLRTELLFGFRLPTAYEMESLEMIKEKLGINKPKLAGLTGGPSLKIAIGYRF